MAAAAGISPAGCEWPGRPSGSEPQQPEQGAGVDQRPDRRQEAVANRSLPAFSTDGHGSAQNQVTAMVLDEIMGHEQVQDLPPLVA